MTPMPVIVGFGGYNAAGRSSFHHSYRRLVLESLPAALRQETLAGLAALMQLVDGRDGHWRDAEGKALTAAEIEARFGEQIIAGTLIRRIELFDDTRVPMHQKLALAPDAAGAICFTVPARQLPKPLPAGWQVGAENADGQVAVHIASAMPLTIFVDVGRDQPVKSAGQLPSGFDPAGHYAARFHPRGLQMSVVGASDAINSVGMPWQRIAAAVDPDQICVFAASGMSQLDEDGFGGMMQARLRGERVTAKQCPLGLNTMPADFINAYLLGNVGMTGAMTGACASFLYNLRLGVDEIKSGRCRVALVGCSEAPLVPEVFDGYGTMGALASVDSLNKLDGSSECDYRRSSRPFGDNCGFTLAESAQFFILMDDALALELGAEIHGAVPEVFVNADGFKKSIPGPGAGNYITMARAVAAAAALLGDEAVRQHSLVLAHGSSTPQNRVTESEILDRVATCFGISDWPVVAVKAYLGHPLAPASGDQLACALGVFAHGILPGIKTITKVADDVHAARLRLPLADVVETPGQRQVAFLNSKGFGGNNATAVVLAPQVLERLLEKRHGANALADWRLRREPTRAAARDYDESALHGNLRAIYHFGEGLIDESAIAISRDALRLPGYPHPVHLPTETPFGDMV